MDWFVRLTGFREGTYEDNRCRLEIDGHELRSKINGSSYKTGVLELASLQSLRERVVAGDGLSGRLKLRNISGDVRQMHQVPEFAGALFQVASQFNLLEMVSPSVTPEHGVTRYEFDRTQGPACAIAAGAGHQKIHIRHACVAAPHFISGHPVSPIHFYCCTLKGGRIRSCSWL